MFGAADAIAPAMKMAYRVSRRRSVRWSACMVASMCDVATHATFLSLPTCRLVRTTGPAPAVRDPSACCPRLRCTSGIRLRGAFLEGLEGLLDAQGAVLVVGVELADRMQVAICENLDAVRILVLVVADEVLNRVMEFADRDRLVGLTVAPVDR